MKLPVIIYLVFLCSCGESINEPISDRTRGDSSQIPDTQACDFKKIISDAKNDPRFQNSDELIVSSFVGFQLKRLCPRLSLGELKNAWRQNDW